SISACNGLKGHFLIEPLKLSDSEKTDLLNRSHDNAQLSPINLVVAVIMAHEMGHGMVLPGTK
uniref:Zinc metalloproteinase-disintegrin-like BaG (Fragments) n=1 Tax=Bothrops alternatus TaxID=64174 RepID=VM3BG_BOTAL|nr:RecName: Full=Zinc metalloproteinase-disintegrin-like BaG; AltName: Full=Snake venom metalloproteinase; Short=SVMP [Bothrops alternatus]